jgi:hypothetical protein
MSRRAAFVAGVTGWGALLAAACGGSSASAPGLEGGAGDAQVEATLPDSGAETASPQEGGETGSSLDGTPMRTAACTPLTQQTGSAASSYHGRMDGTVSYVLPQGGLESCNGDDSHVHLQVLMNGSVYDVAIDIGEGSPGDMILYETDIAMPDGAWSEGWHSTDGLSYQGLGLTPGEFTLMSPAEINQKLVAELATVNHVSVFCVGYQPQGNGCHDVHYENDSDDGALVLEPLSPVAHVLFFHFSDQTW